MRRREFIGLVGGAVVAWPLATRAQQPGIRRIGVLLPGTTTRAGGLLMRAFYQELRDFGWVEGQNVAFERRYAEGHYERLADLAVELARLKVDVIVTASTPPARAAKTATDAIPIVMMDPGDPVVGGLVASLSRPGGNVTGISSVAPDLATKRLQILKETAPTVSRIAILFNAAIPPTEVAMKEMTAAAPALGVQIRSVPVDGLEALEDAFAAITREGEDGLLVFADPLTHAQEERIVGFAVKIGIPALFADRTFVDVGGLISYGPSYPGMFRRGAYYVDRILRGAKPGDIPVEQPTKFELVINLKAARALGLTVPPTLLARADEVIE